MTFIYKDNINHRKPNYYSNGSFYLVQCWNCNHWKQNKKPESGICEHCGWSFYYADRNERKTKGLRDQS